MVGAASQELLAGREVAARTTSASCWSSWPCSWRGQRKGITYSTVGTRVFAKAGSNHGSKLSTNGQTWFVMPNRPSWAVLRSFVRSADRRRTCSQANKQLLETDVNGNKPKVPQYFCASFSMDGQGRLSRPTTAGILDGHEQKPWTRLVT